VKIADIGVATFRFHRAVYVSLTEKCPIRCRHCFVESGPLREEQADVEAFTRWIAGVAAAPGLEIVFFSGGEPFSHPLALRAGLRACRERDVYPVVCTSGFFGKSDESTRRLLDSFPDLGCLWISTDVFHEEFVPLEHLRRVAEIARERKITVGFQIVDDDPEHSAFMQRFSEVVGYDVVPRGDILIVPLAKQGRAEREVTASEAAALDISREAGFDAVPATPCTWLGTPWVREDGVVSACPNLDVFRAEQHPLQLGRLDDADFTALSALADADGYLQTLRVFGPAGLVERHPVESWGWNRAAFRGSSICDLCHSLAKVPGLPDKVRAAVQSNGGQAKLDFLRRLMYAEEPSKVPS
jgi:MoaA/NifB/PqqE/SkfB family radical SAM enzyme